MKRPRTQRAARDTVASVSGAIEALSGGVVRSHPDKDDSTTLTFGTVYTPAVPIGARVSSKMNKGFRLVEITRDGPNRKASKLHSTGSSSESQVQRRANEEHQTGE